AEAPGAAGEAWRDMKLVGTPDPANDAPAVDVEEELELLRRLCPDAELVRLPARRGKLREALAEGTFGLLHLACHGSFGGSATADGSAVVMEDGPFSALELSPRMAGPMRGAAPLIFFNACHSGRLGFSLTGLGSWGARLVHL